MFDYPLNTDNFMLLSYIWYKLQLTPLKLRVMIQQISHLICSKEQNSKNTQQTIYVNTSNKSRYK